MPSDEQRIYDSLGPAAKRLNAHLTRGVLVGQLHAKKSKPDGRRESEAGGVESGEESVGYTITLTSYRRRCQDEHDNARFSLKGLCDRITEWLGFASDGDERLTWEYHQCRTSGRCGVLVAVEKRVKTLHKAA